MKITKNFIFRPQIIISSLIIIGILITMSISDVYYTNLEKKFPLLSKNESINGKITNLKTHFDYSYLEIDLNTKKLIRPTKNEKYNPCDFNEFISVGDSFVHEEFSNEIKVIRNNTTYTFNLTKY